MEILVKILVLLLTDCDLEKITPIFKMPFQIKPVLVFDI